MIANIVTAIGSSSSTDSYYFTVDTKVSDLGLQELMNRTKIDILCQQWVLSADPNGLRCVTAADY